MRVNVFAKPDSFVVTFSAKEQVALLTELEELNQRLGGMRYSEFRVLTTLVQGLRVRNPLHSTDKKVRGC